MLFLINEARANPQAEAQRLLSMLQTDPDLRGAAAETDVSGFLAQMDSLPPLPPLAFNTRLIDAALDHDQAMLAGNSLSAFRPGLPHNPGRGDRRRRPSVLSARKRRLGNRREHLCLPPKPVTGASLTDYVDFFEAGLLLDWGNPDFGHLRNLMAPEVGEMASVPHVPFNQIGIGIITGVQPTTPSALNVGPAILTQEFAWSAGTQFLTGVAYQDDNHDGAYSIGEGLGGVTITATGNAGQGTFQTTTWDSGGYSLELPPGPYTVSSIGPQAIRN